MGEFHRQDVALLAHRVVARRTVDRVQQTSAGGTQGDLGAALGLGRCGNACRCSTRPSTPHRSALILVRAPLVFLVGVDETPECLVLVASFGQ